ncbi:MAG TPA: hypothetical protein VFP84_24580 [Kofleriaceae bacterium]|nr:hypothetical protein [Kofleriaceae bacterium]
MTRTHSILGAALLCAAASACAARGGSRAPVRITYSTKLPDGPVQVRNFNGDVLPPYAIADAGGGFLQVECRNGQVYQIVARPHELYSRSAQESWSVTGGRLDSFCDNVHNSRLDYNHVH